ncbi:uncharacterized protein APUU_70904S [Aspergillus puulaauensis]|uniref:GPI anchored protein n=1 Tax=Aspergillus puulaauensis TaxID=1220207 RepID=A0A7R8ARH4_9EURO|nr:uncharacterized protein APUU_70904S [Aspergillus puulaauensis]BCS29334.1 hypothetical protein APUU_70904S [Aspergillus puulaauensis]
MKLSTIISTALCLGASQVVAVETQTSTLTTTITRTLVRVNAVTPTATPSSSTPLIHTSTPLSSTLIPSSTATATATVKNAPSDEPIHSNMATGFEGNLPIALAGGAFALLFGAL